MKYGIVEDQTIVRQMLKGRIPGCVWEGANLAALKDRPELDLLILDLELPDGNALDWIENQTKTPILVILTSIKEDYLVMRAMKSGVFGLVHKEDTVEVLEQIIKSALEGNITYSKTFQGLRSKITADPDAFFKLLTEREQEVLKLLGMGYSNSEVASKIGLKESGVADHKNRIMHKVGAKTQLELMAYASRKGFVKLDA